MPRFAKEVTKRVLILHHVLLSFRIQLSKNNALLIGKALLVSKMDK